MKFKMKSPKCVISVILAGYYYYFSSPDVAVVACFCDK